MAHAGWGVTAFRGCTRDALVSGGAAGGKPDHTGQPMRCHDNTDLMI